MRHQAWKEAGNAQGRLVLTALLEVPRHQGANDALEEIKEGSADPDNVVVAPNIKHTLNAFPHETRAEFTYGQSESIVRGSIGKLGQIQSLSQASSPSLVTRKSSL